MLNAQRSMTTKELMAVVTDARMTPDAVRVALHFAGLGAGEHAYDFDALSMLLEEAGEKRIRKALARGESCGYLIRHKGGQKTDRFEFSPARNGGESESVSPAQAAGQKFSPPQEAGERAFSPPQAAGESGSPTTTSTTTPTPPPTRVNERPSDTDLARLRMYLGDHARAVDMMLDSSGQHPTNWVAAVMGKYGPSGTQLGVAMQGLPAERRAAVLANALMDFATTGKPYGNRHFDAFVNKAANDERNGSKARSAERGGDSGGTPAEARSAAGSQRRGFIIE